MFPLLDSERAFMQYVSSPVYALGKKKIERVDVSLCIGIKARIWVTVLAI